MSKTEHTTQLTYAGLRNKTKEWMTTTLICMGKWHEALESDNAALTERLRVAEMALDEIAEIAWNAYEADNTLQAFAVYERARLLNAKEQTKP